MHNVLTVLMNMVKGREVNEPDFSEAHIIVFETYYMRKPQRGYCEKQVQLQSHGSVQKKPV